MKKNEPFLVNPCIKNPLMVINPKKKRKKTIRKKVKRKVKYPVSVIGSAVPREELGGIIKTYPKIKKVKKIKKIKKIKRKIPKTISEKKFPRIRRKVMAKRKKKLEGKKHRLTVYGKKGKVRISPRAKLVKKSRGRLLNPQGILSADIMSSGLNIVDILAIAGGGIVIRYIPNVLPLPDIMKKGVMRFVVQGATSVGLGMIIGKVLKKERLGKMIMIGGLVATASSIIDKYLLKGKMAQGELEAYLPENTMSAYLLPETPETISNYSIASETTSESYETSDDETSIDDDDEI